MSLIREALKKKAADGKEPAIELPDRDGNRKKPGTTQIVQYGVLIFLLLGLVGALVYFFLPTGTPPKKIQIPQAPQLIVKKAEKKSQEVVLPIGKDSWSPITPRKVETKAPQPTLEIGSAKKETAQKSERLVEPLPVRLSSPRPTAKTTPKPSSPTKLVTKAKPPDQVPEPSPAQETKEGMDPLPMVRLFNEAVKNQQKGLYSAAIQGYREVLAERPNHWETYNNLGLIYQNQKQYPKSLEMFQKALSLNPRYPKGYNNLGLVYLNLGKLEEATNQFRKALGLDPEFIPAYINLAVGYKRQGQTEQARKSLQNALEHDPESLEAHYNLGLFWENEEVEHKALEHYQQFVSKAQGSYADLANELRKKWPGLK